MVRRAGSLGLFALHVQNPQAAGVAKLCQKTQQAQWRGSNLANPAHWGKPKKQTQQAQQAPRNASGAGIRPGGSGAAFPPPIGARASGARDCGGAQAGRDCGGAQAGRGKGKAGRKRGGQCSTFAPQDRANGPIL